MHMYIYKRVQERIMYVHIIFIIYKLDSQIIGCIISFIKEMVGIRTKY